MQAKTIQQPVDPMLAQEQQQAQQAQISTLQTQAEGDTANIMARFGTRMALAGMVSPGTNASAPRVGGA